MKYLFTALNMLLALSLAAQTPQCRPVLVACNGLAATILPINTDADPETDDVGVRVKANDFVRSCSSPCGASTFKYRIRKQGAGTDIPSDSTLFFSCSELGVQELELWAIDAQGNAGYALTYIIIQDNLRQCEAPVQPVLSGCFQDRMPPNLLLFNGLSINIIPSAAGGVARVLPGDFIKSKTDNCSGSMILRIRKAGQDVGVPATTSVTFDCSETGTQEVEIWAGDLKGNWVWVNTYVLIQVSFNDCDPLLTPGCSPDRTPVITETLHGLSACIGANGQLRLRASEWVRKRSENCSVPVALRIRKVGDGSGPPTDTEVQFSCQEVGIQLVEIWSRDLAGNWSFTETYVIVQDNHGDCGQFTGSLITARTSPKEASRLHLSPNPASQVLLVEQENEPFMQIEMTDLTGRIVKQIHLKQPVHQYSIQVHDLPTGLYQVRAGGQVKRVVID